MNILLIIAIVLAGRTILIDHKVHHLPQWLSIVLYTGAVALFVIGMILARKGGA